MEKQSTKTTELSGLVVSKNNISIHLIGTVDELNSHLGLVKTMLSNDDTWQFSWKTACQFIEKIQKNLMKMMSHVSNSENEKYFFSANDVIELRREIQRLLDNLPKQTKFATPGKNLVEAHIQIARAVARRTERLYAAACEERRLCLNAAEYLNKLSDYLYFLSQQESLINVNFINQITGI